jgi:hypothetical protein
MKGPKTALAWAAVIGLMTIRAQIVQAGGKCCQECGCHTEKKLVCLISRCEEIKSPVYECVCQDVFCPDKSPVCSTEYRCDTTYSLHKHREQIGGPSGCDKPCVCWTCCTSKTESGCKTLTAASPKGCWKQSTVKKPTGENCTKRVPTFRWVAIEMCPKCDSRNQPKRCD